jgi:pimeloyl-ACP methyl ester carboxylesterase
MTAVGRKRLFEARNGVVVEAPDGRRLTVEVSGAPRGLPVVLMHGTPGSGSGPRPRSSVLYRLNVRLVSYDRPGYGGSDRHERRSVADAAADVATIVDALDIGSFAVVGRSGGGPHALACAALLGERVTRTAILVGMAPADAGDLDWFDGMNDDNVRAYTAADSASLITEMLTARADATRLDPETLLTQIELQMTEPDRRVVRDISMRRLLAETYAEAVRTGPYGWIDDVLALRATWGFSLESIRCPVLLWHGADDTFSPVSHARWLAERIDHAQIHVEKNAAHFTAVEILPDLFSWLAGSSSVHSRR